jgi:hypothetical protein
MILDFKRGLMPHPIPVVKQNRHWAGLFKGKTE